MGPEPKWHECDSIPPLSDEPSRSIGMDMGKERKGSKIKSRNGTGVGPEMRGRARDLDA